jgi:hypothetical protein
MRLNREQLRRANKQGDLFTSTQVRMMMDASGSKILKRAVYDYSAVLAFCLRDKLGFGHDRATRFLNDVSTMFQDIQDGRLSVEDIKKVLKDEINVEIF